MNRRSLMLGGVVAGLSLKSGLASAAGEKFPILQGDVLKVPARFRRRKVRVNLDYAPGTIVVDTAARYLYLILRNGNAMRYGIGVGRQGFAWSGNAVIRRKAKWPTWTPPPEMVERDEFAAEWADGMPGGPRNPLGARALYLYRGNQDTMFRIHGTIVPSSIGKAVSSGCIRMINVDVADLYERVPVGTPVVVLQGRSPLIADERPRKRTLFENLFD